MKLVGYKRHLQQFGPDGLIEVAREDPDMRGQIAELEAAIVRWNWQFQINDKGVVERRKDDEGYVTKDDSVVICACGCGRTIPPNRLKTKGRRAIYYKTACAQRMFKQRHGGKGVKAKSGRAK